MCTVALFMILKKKKGNKEKRNTEATQISLEN